MGDEHGTDDPDRAAILARRRRFIALAISGLAVSGCKKPGPDVCLRVASPDAAEGSGPEPEPEPDSAVTGPIVEDPGAPLETGETGGEEAGETGEAIEGAPPVADPHPQPCLRKRPNPQPCLMVY